MDFELDPSVTAIKELLNKEQIKLWLPPYHTDKEEQTKEEVEKLAGRFSSELSLPVEACVKCLKQLQITAIENVKERERFRATGKATLKIRISSEGGGRTFNVNIGLSNKGQDLKEMISQEITTPVERFKVIFKGKILKDDETLEAQGLKHGNIIMVIVLSGDTSELKNYEKHIDMLDKTKADVKLLANSDDNYLEIADQSGKRLNLPKKEKKALVLAMTLHEKGRAALKKGEYALALVMLLEAEKEFSQCDSALLKSVDNYGVLSLDIAWCYLNLQSITQLPNAEERLHQCELSFKQSYGENLERLIALKGSNENESALFMRLHLLQAVICYHQNRLSQARELLREVEKELNNLKVDDNSLSHIMEIGYTAAEARLALREAKGDVNIAVSIIENKRAEKLKNAEAEAIERKKIKERKKLGKCVNGNWIEPEYHKAMMSMGYSHEASRWALAQSNNNIYTAVNLIQDHPELIVESSNSDSSISTQSIEQLVAVGYEKNIAKVALKKHHGDVEKAVEELAENDGTVINLQDYLIDSDESDEGPSTSKSKESFEEQMKAWSRVAEGISNTEEDHLDLNLEAEEVFLQKYKELLAEK